MKKGKWITATTWHTIFLVVLFSVSGTALYLSLPREARFRYEFQKGRPWMHESLYAPYDFAIQKSKYEIAHEKDSILRSQVPYFNYIDSIAIRQLTQLSKKIDELSSQQHKNQINVNALKIRILNIFTKIYSSGLLEHSYSSYPYLSHKTQLKIVKNNIGKEVQIGTVYSLKSAYGEVVTRLDELKLDHPEWSKIIDELLPESFLTSNLVYDQEKNTQNEDKLLDNISTSYGIVQEGERIVSQGDVINAKIFSILESLRFTYEKNRGQDTKFSIMVFGRMIFIGILLLTLFLFLYNIRRKLLLSKRDISFTIITLTMMIVFCSIIIKSGTFSIYVVPFTALALIIRTFLDTRVAIFVNTVAALIVGYMVPNGYEFVLLQIPVGSIAVISQNKMLKREQLIVTSLIVFVSYCIIYTGISMIQESNFSEIDWEPIKWFAFNAIFTLITYLMVFILEKSFGFVSDVTLIELTFSNQKLLKKMAFEAPGTLHHSLQVANLSEQAITLIGGNALLVRAGALYHDVGKIINPQYFTENQAFGINPHDQLSFEESAKIIMDHVNKGVELAKKHKIPEQIIDFIRTHHGTTKTGYFYLKSINSSEEVDEKKFTYPGPLPTTRETAVVMLTDSIEAASRSLEVKSSENIKNLIDTMFRQRVDTGQFEYAPLTFRDIRLLKDFYLEKLINIYHIRVNYPESNL